MTSEVSPFLGQFDAEKNSPVLTYTTLSYGGAYLLIKTMKNALHWEVIGLPIELNDGMWAVTFKNPNHSPASAE